jgi:hypothetical protein
MDVSLALPALFAMPLRVAPSGAALDAASARLQWSVPAERLKPGCQVREKFGQVGAAGALTHSHTHTHARTRTQEVLTAVFKVSADEAACVDARRSRRTSSCAPPLPRSPSLSLSLLS